MIHNLGQESANSACRQLYFFDFCGKFHSDVEKHFTEGTSIQTGMFLWKALILRSLFFPHQRSPSQNLPTRLKNILQHLQLQEGLSESEGLRQKEIYSFLERRWCYCLSSQSVMGILFRAPWSSCVKNRYIGNITSMSVMLYYTAD